MIHAHKLGRNVLAGLICLVIVLGTGSSAWAVLLAYEGFDYPAGEFLVDSAVGAPVHNGGSGWAGPWDDTQGAPVAPLTHFSSVIQTGSLGYTDSLGNALVTAGGKLFASGETGTSQSGRSLADRRSSPASGDTLSTWFSFLGQRIGPVNMDTPPNPNGFDGTYRRGANLAIFDNGGAATQPEKFNFGGENSNQQYPLGGAPPMYEDRWQTRLPGVTASVVVPHPYPQNPEGSATSNANGAQVRDAFAAKRFDQLSLYVMRIDHVAGSNNATDASGNDNIYVWMDPDLNATPSDASADIKLLAADIVAAAAAVTPVPVNPPFNGDGGEFNFNRLRIFAGNVAGTTPYAQMLMDEMRIGETFADVAPFIPVVTGTPGDYNGNDKVDNGDYTTWRNHLNQAFQLDNEGPGITPGMVTPEDYDFWKSHFNEPGAGAGSVSGVPEPCTLVLLALAAGCCAGWTRRRDR